jgi:hypothetical protein
METNDACPMSKPLWPKDKPIPTFSSEKEEAQFWDTYEFEFLDEDEGWEAVPRHDPDEVFGVTFEEPEMLKLRQLARKRGVPVRKVLADILHDAIAKAG